MIEGREKGEYFWKCERRTPSVTIKHRAEGEPLTNKKEPQPTEKTGLLSRSNTPSQEKPEKSRFEKLSKHLEIDINEVDNEHYFQVTKQGSAYTVYHNHQKKIVIPKPSAKLTSLLDEIWQSREETFQCSLYSLGAPDTFAASPQNAAGSRRGERLLSTHSYSFPMRDNAFVTQPIASIKQKMQSVLQEYERQRKPPPPHASQRVLALQLKDRDSLSQGAPSSNPPSPGGR